MPADHGQLLGCEAFRYGFDLFHAGFFWEAHEVWENLWQVARRTEAAQIEASALQTLIQITAAELQLRMGQPAGAISLALKASRRASSPQEPESRPDET